MKTTKYISMAIAIATFASCDSDKDFATSWQNDPAAVTLNVTVSSGIFTRSNPLGDATQQTTFNQGDKISICTDRQSAVTYTYNGEMWTFESDHYLIWKENQMTFTAYYPAVEGASEKAFTLPTDQSNEEKIAAADYMTFTGSQTKPATNNELTLGMIRQTARVTVKINEFGAEYDGTSPVVTEMMLYSGAAGYVNGVAAGGVVGISPYVQNLNEGVAQVGTTYTALVIPTAAQTDERYLTMRVNGTALMVKGIPAMEAGKSYRFNLKIGYDNVEINATVSDLESWGDAESEENINE